MGNRWFAMGAALMAFAIVLGAFGAHSLKTVLSSASMEVYHTAFEYHVLHSLGLMVVASAYGTKLITRKRMNQICFLFTIGILLFSGSLYLLALTGKNGLGVITPIGGLMFIIAWLALSVEAFRGKAT